MKNIKFILIRIYELLEKLIFMKIVSRGYVFEKVFLKQLHLKFQHKIVLV